MRILVCGGRDYTNWRSLSSVLDGLWPEDSDELVVIQGGASGADFLAKVWARDTGAACEEYPADWKAFGKSAGYIRNKQMLEEGKPDLVVAFPGGKGTADMVRQSKAAGVEVKEVQD